MTLEGAVVVKIGTSSLAGPEGIDPAAVSKLAGEVATLIGGGRPVIVVTSGAAAAGIAAAGVDRPHDGTSLRALAAIGQQRLMRSYDDAFAAEGLACGQVLLSVSDFGARRHYLHARATIERLCAYGAVPVVNENDALADDETRFGDNDRLAALVANLVGAECLVLLTDTEGLFDADPRTGGEATLVEEVQAADAAFDEVAGGPGSEAGRGGMGSKLAAARLAAWCGVRAVIASASRPGVVAAAVSADGVGTTVRPRPERLSQRRAWIAFALPARGRVLVDDGARRALVEREASLLPAGVVAVEGEFARDDAVEIATADGAVFAKGLSRLPSGRAAEWVGRRSRALAAELSGVVCHRDDLVVLDSASSISRQGR